MKTTEKKIFILCPYGLGDTLMVCGYLNSIEEKYHTKVVLIIKRSHISIMQLYGIEDYVIYDFSPLEIKGIESRTIRGNICPGEIFLARPGYDEEDSLFKFFIDGHISFREMYRKALGLDENAIFHMPSRYPEVTEALLKKLPGAIEDVVLLLPEMNAPEVDTVPLALFEKYSGFFADENIVVNMLHPSGNLEKNCVDLTLDETIALAVNCKRVVSSRSGICDILYPYVKKMDVIYPNSVFYELYQFKRIFDSHNSGVHEFTIFFGDYFKEKGYESCSIYGFGFVGLRMVHCLEAEHIPIDFIIDKRADDIKTKYKVYHPEDELPDTDLIIITPEIDAQSIRNMLKRKIHAEVVFYKDFIKECGSIYGLLFKSQQDL